jgi:uncharacterized membrane protein
VSTQPLPPQDAGDVVEPVEEEDRAVAEMETTVAYALRYGVLLSFLVILAASAWLFVDGGTGYAGVRMSGPSAVDHLVAYHAGGSTVWFPTTPGQVFDGVRHGRPYALIGLGLLILIATPVFRVAVSVLTFAYERDRTYTLITLYVLTVLIVSFVIGKGG